MAAYFRATSPITKLKSEAHAVVSRRFYPSKQACAVAAGGNSMSIAYYLTARERKLTDVLITYHAVRSIEIHISLSSAPDFIHELDLA
ncbi:1-aminocyclopropane-1-carboxylate deaminase/D-cysteine desulfhydrase-like pyridoxal-dependent ACC family enzyme [Salinibacter ruber]|jgi:1-aminocyclopropane-1-carboxylate deaminase/D-cysteine desulfhydrase-like pyridoxal-dependent ACC family enzyme|nr:1-aminocyclopropane-1-carboxylate deaminase/D-cysteine desulfhydrase-like pyridoxal-dependent ACC family enzyme [Salinibacter ruber]